MSFSGGMELEVLRVLVCPILFSPRVDFRWAGSVLLRRLFLKVAFHSMSVPDQLLKILAKLMRIKP